MREYESGVDVFVYVCIWFTHQSSRVTSVTRPGARPRQRCACVLPFRLLQELSVADGRGVRDGAKQRKRLEVRLRGGPALR